VSRARRLRRAYPDGSAESRKVSEYPESHEVREYPESLYQVSEVLEYPESHRYLYGRVIILAIYYPGKPMLDSFEHLLTFGLIV